MVLGPQKGRAAQSSGSSTGSNGDALPSPPLGWPCRPQLTLLFDVVLLLRDLGLVVGDTPDDGGPGGGPAPHVDLPAQGLLGPPHLGRGQGPRVQQLDGVDLPGHGLLLQKALLILLRGDTGGGQVTGEPGGGGNAAAPHCPAGSAYTKGPYPESPYHSQMRNLRHREVMKIAQGPTAGKWYQQDVNPDRVAPERVSVTSTPVRPLCMTKVPSQLFPGRSVRGQRAQAGHEPREPRCNPWAEASPSSVRRNCPTPSLVAPE